MQRIPALIRPALRIAGRSATLGPMLSHAIASHVVMVHLLLYPVEVAVSCQHDRDGLGHEGICRPCRLNCCVSVERAERIPRGAIRQVMLDRQRHSKAVTGHMWHMRARIQAFRTDVVATKRQKTEYRHVNYFPSASNSIRY